MKAVLAALAGIAVLAAVIPAQPSCDCATFALLESIVKDPGDLNHYRALNATVPTRAPGEQRVVFMGDSITEGWPLIASFPARTEYYGRGIAGQTTSRMLVRFRADVLNLDPTIVVILAGINDVGGVLGPVNDVDIENNLATMADLAAAHGAQVILSSLLPVSDDHGMNQSATHPLYRLTAINAWIASYAAEHGHGFVDYFAAMNVAGVMRTDLSTDGLHPSPAGYGVMSELLKVAIARWEDQNR